MKEVILASGEKLGVGLVPFTDAKRLYTAIAGELKGVRVDLDLDTPELIKNVFCSLIDSKRVDEALDACMKRCTYRGEKITAETWEDEKARGDYLDVCAGVLTEVVRPFMKSLFAQFKTVSNDVESIPKQKS